MTEYLYTLKLAFKLDVPLSIDDVGDFLKAISEIIPEGTDIIVCAEFSSRILYDGKEGGEQDDRQNP